MSAYGWCVSVRTNAALVAELKPNDWGLYDMHGNAFEWVADYYSQFYYGECAEQGAVTDPAGSTGGSAHVLRGGAWNVNNPLACTSTARYPMPLLDRAPFSAGVGMRDATGFRVVREAPEGSS